VLVFCILCNLAVLCCYKIPPSIKFLVLEKPKFVVDHFVDAIVEELPVILLVEAFVAVVWSEKLSCRFDSLDRSPLYR
jgi:hypothetical protein